MVTLNPNSVIYVVLATQGVYEDAVSWVAGAYTDNDEAQRVVTQKKSALDERQIAYRQWTKTREGRHCSWPEKMAKYNEFFDGVEHVDDYEIIPVLINTYRKRVTD